MAAKQQKHTSVQKDLLRVSRLHFFLAAAAAAQIIIFDAWQLLSPAAVMERWLATALFLVTVTGVWYFAHAGHSIKVYHYLLFVLIVADLAFASFAVYNQRGMASRAVILYVFPLLVTTVLRRRSALFATAVLCIASYVSAAVSYFVLNFNEGYKIELYGEVGFYSAMFILIAWILALRVKAED